jgi:hypothetical protein
LDPEDALSLQGFESVQDKGKTTMAPSSNKSWLAVKCASGAALLLVPVLALAVLGFDSLSLSRADGASFNDAFAPQAKVGAQPATAQSPVSSDTVDVHLTVWEDTLNRVSIRR